MDKVKEKRTKRKDTTPGVAASNAYGINSDLYKAVIENALEGFIILDIKGNILDANEAFSRMNGYSRKELLSMKVYDLAPTKITSEDYARLIKGHISMGGASFETQHRCKDGRIIDLAVSSKYLDTGGGIFFSFHRDITEQKKKQTREQANHKHTREELKESEDRYRTLIELGNKIGEAVIMLKDTDGREGMHVYVSDQWPNITGYSREELLDMSFFDLVIPEDKEAAIERHRQKMSGKALPDLIELSIIHKNGKKLSIEITSAVTSYKGMFTNVVYVRDVGERKKAEKSLKESEEKYRFFFENTPIAIFECNYSKIKPLFDELRNQGVTDFKVYFENNHDIYLKVAKLSKTSRLNLAGLKLYEAENEELIDNEFSQYPEIQRYAKEITAGLAEGKRNFIIDESIRTLKGNRKYLRAFISVAKGCEQTLERIYVSHLDITELKQIEKELRNNQQQLETLVDERTAELQEQIQQRIEYTRLLVHELKTPLTPMLGASELLARNLKDEQSITTAKAIYSSALKLEKRVNELLDQARLETCSLELKREIVDINKVLNEVFEYVKPRLAKKKQCMVLDTSPSLPMIYADEERLNQIILNLIDNSFKNTPIGGSIALRAYEEKENLIIEVKDNGSGIDIKNQNNLFKPYSQTSVGCENMSGLGLGLFLCKSLVELHGGKIWVNSSRGKGSVFSFSIPASSPIQ